MLQTEKERKAEISDAIVRRFGSQDRRHVEVPELCGNCKQRECLAESRYCPTCISAMAAIEKPWPARIVIVAVAFMMAALVTGAYVLFGPSPSLEEHMPSIRRSAP